MRIVKIKTWVPAELAVNRNGKREKVEGTDCFTDDFNADAKFLEWGLELEYDDNAMGSFTVALVELPDGTVQMVRVENIKFIN